MAGCLWGRGRGGSGTMSAKMSPLTLLSLLQPPSGHQLRGQGSVGGETWDSIESRALTQMDPRPSVLTDGICSGGGGGELQKQKGQKFVLHSF